MKKIIVTGANGQLGSEIKRIADEHSDFNFLFTDIDSLDLTNKVELANLFEQQQPDYLINCAAYTAVDKAEDDKINAELINAEVPEQIALLCNKFSCKLIHISTDYVFSGKMHKPVTEEDETSPASIYGKTKLLGEQLVNKHTDAVILRTSWLYSIYGNNFVKSMLRLGREREQLGIVYDQIGSPTNAADLASAVLTIIELNCKGNNWNSGIYHFSNEGVCSWYDFAYEIMNLAGIDCKIKPILTHEYPLPAPRPSFSVMDKKKLKETFGIEIPYWKTSLQKVVKELN